jgi:hypothetical protein
MKSVKFILPCAFLALAGCNPSIGCDNPQVLKQVKDMVRSRLTDSVGTYSRSPFVKGSELNQALFDETLRDGYWTKIKLEFKGIRDRGNLPGGGSDCAAIGTLSKLETTRTKLGIEWPPAEDLGVSYKIERDTAGGHVLTVRVSGS